jgi:GDPmannose 4,6-dehydratase
VSKYISIPKRTVLIVGINGQDGSYLAENFVKLGWHVIGLGRQSTINEELNQFKIKYFKIDLIDTIRYEELLVNVIPDVIFHTAAVHGSSGFKYESMWKDSHIVNTHSLHASLEFIRKFSNKSQIVYFGSSKMFGNIDGSVVDELTTKQSSCIYSITKNSSASLIEYYRDQHGISGSIIWLFNHDSLRRNISYFLPKIVNILYKSINNSLYKEPIITLDFWSDWGYAKEYMELLANNFDKIIGNDFILATGKTVWINTMVKDLFENHGLDFNNHIKTQMSNKKNKDTYWEADISKFRKITGITPQMSNVEVCEEMLFNLLEHKSK